MKTLFKDLMSVIFPNSDKEYTSKHMWLFICLITALGLFIWGLKFQWF
jgi:hypothetical protein